MIHAMMLVEKSQLFDIRTNIDSDASIGPSNGAIFRFAGRRNVISAVK
jgi:hypothetical protein